MEPTNQPPIHQGTFQKNFQKAGLCFCCQRKKSGKIVRKGGVCILNVVVPMSLSINGAAGSRWPCKLLMRAYGVIKSCEKNEQVLSVSLSFDVPGPTSFTQ